MGRKFEFRKLVDFCDVDLGGGLYHPNYYKYLDTARVTALSDVGVSFKSLFERNTALVVVSIDSRFIAPAFFEDNLKIVTEVVSIGKSSIKLIQTITKSQGQDAGDTLLHTSEITLAHVSLELKRATPLPQDLVDRLA